MINDINVIYQFWLEPESETVEQGLALTMPIVKQCEDFSASIGILCMCDHIGVFNGKFHIRIQFNIHASQNIVLHKMAALFSFAAIHKLLFRNQFFLSKEE